MINTTLNFNYWFVLKKKNEFQFNTSTGIVKAEYLLFNLSVKRCTISIPFYCTTFQEYIYSVYVDLFVGQMFGLTSKF